MTETAGGTPAGRGRLQVAAGFTALFVVTGVHLSFGILFKPILADLGSDRATLALAATASLLLNAGVQPFIGALVDRVGPRRVIVPSVALMALGTGLVALARETWQIILAYGIVSSAGYTGTNIVTVSVHTNRWFPRRGAMMIAVTATGFSLGQLVFSQVATYSAEAYGWRGAYALLAALLVVLLAVLAAWLRDAPSPPAIAQRGSSREASSARAVAFRTRAFWWMTGGLMGCGFTDFLLTTHLPAFATDLGLTPAVAANAMSLWAAANIIGILAAGGLAGRFGARPALILTYAVRATSLFFLLTVRESWQLYLFATLFGATFFTTAPLSSVLIGELFGSTRHGVIFGTATLFHHAAGALASYAGGLVFEISGSYLPIFFAGGAIVVGSAILSALARPRR